MNSKDTNFLTFPSIKLFKHEQLPLRSAGLNPVFPHRRCGMTEMMNTVNYLFDLSDQAIEKWQTLSAPEEKAAARQVHDEAFEALVAFFAAL